MDYFEILSLLIIVLMIVIITFVIVLFVKFLRYLDRKLVVRKTNLAIDAGSEPGSHPPTKKGSSEWILGLVFLLTAIVITPTQIKYLQGRYVSRNWASTYGRVVTSNVESGRGSIDEVSYCVEVTYRYIFRGLSYSGNTIRFGSRCYNDYGKAQREADLYPQGEDVLVYFDSANPKESVLEPGGNLGSPVGQLLFSLVFGVIGLLILVSLLREKLKR